MLKFLYNPLSKQITDCRLHFLFYHRLLKESLYAYARKYCMRTRLRHSAQRWDVTGGTVKRI